MTQQDLDRAKVIVVVFKQNGCGACQEYVPRFKRIAPAYAGCLPILVVEAGDPKYETLANRLGVHEIPVTFVLRKPTGVVKIVGGVSDQEIHQLLGYAANLQACEI